MVESRKTRSRAATAAVAAAVAVGVSGPSAVAQDGAPAVSNRGEEGPCWCESNDGGSDAGDLPQSAHTTEGQGPLLCIEGGTRKQAAPGAGVDLRDMYLIRICDPMMFLATTVPPDAGASFNTMLWLFDGEKPDVGEGWLGNDNDPITMTVRSRLLPVPSDGEPPLTEPGLYYLAISGFRDEPADAGGDLLFMLGGPFEISGPDGPGGANPIAAWMPTGDPGGGGYLIRLRGVTYAAGASGGDCNGNGRADACDIASGSSEDRNGNGEPDECECLADIDGSGDVGLGDVLRVLAAWGPCPPEEPCPEDIDFDGDVDFADLLMVLASWGPC